MRLAGSLKVTLVFAAGLAGCTGLVGDIGSPSTSTGTGLASGRAGSPGSAGSNGGGLSGPTGSTPGTGGTAVTSTDPNAAGPMPIRRLTQREYNNTVADLLGDTTHPADGFPDDDHLDGVEDNYPFPLAADVDSLLATRLRDAASTLAAAANLQTLVPCTPTAATEQTCLGQFLDKFGTRALSPSPASRRANAAHGPLPAGADFGNARFQRRHPSGDRRHAAIGGVSLSLGARTAGADPRRRPRPSRAVRDRFALVLLSLGVDA